MFCRLIVPLHIVINEPKLTYNRTKHCFYSLFRDVIPMTVIGKQCHFGFLYIAMNITMIKMFHCTIQPPAEKNIGQREVICDCFTFNLSYQICQPLTVVIQIKNNIYSTISLLSVLSSCKMVFSLEFLNINISSGKRVYLHL